MIPAEIPALPLHTAGKYVAAAYVVLFAIVLIYVAIMAIRLAHMERDMGDLLELAEERDPVGAANPVVADDAGAAGAASAGAASAGVSPSPEQPLAVHQESARA